MLKDTVYNFINSMIKESKYCRYMMEKHSTECWICDTAYVDSDVKVRDLSYHWKI